MYDSLLYSLMAHLEYLEHILKATIKIEMAAIRNNVDAIEMQTKNRERLFSITESSQSNIEDKISYLGKIPVEIKEILETWAVDVSNFIEEIDRKNISAAIQLEKIRKDLTQEIATIFNIRQAHEGYNLTSVRK